MKVLKKIGSALFLFLIVVICAFIIRAGRGDVPFVFGYRIFKVVTESMAPTIQERTCILVRQTTPASLNIGDIITFISEDPAIAGFYNTHRIQEIKTDDSTGELSFITKGDSSEEADAYAVSEENIIGLYIGELPYGAWIYRMTEILADSRHYFIIVILPLLLCMISYMKQLFSAIFSKEDDTPDEK